MPDEISPEDRERLAKSKFKEWFNECATEWFPEAFDKRVTETHDAAGTKQIPGQPPVSQGQSSGQPARTKRRSLLEECLSNAIGW